MTNLGNLVSLSEYLQGSLGNKAAVNLAGSTRFTSLSFQAVLFDIQSQSSFDSGKDISPAPPVLPAVTEQPGESSVVVRAQSSSMEPPASPASYETTSRETAASNTAKNSQMNSPEPVSAPQTQKPSEAAPVSNEDQGAKNTPADRSNESQAKDNSTRTEGRENESDKAAQEGQKKSKKNENSEETEESGENETAVRLRMMKVKAEMTVSSAAGLEKIKEWADKLKGILEDDSLDFEEKARQLMAVLSEAGLNEQTVMKDLEVSDTAELAGEEDLLGQMLARLGAELAKMARSKTDNDSIAGEAGDGKQAVTADANLNELLEEFQPDWLKEMLGKDADRKEQIDELVDRVVRRVQEQLTGEKEIDSAPQTAAREMSAEEMAEWLARLKSKGQSTETTTAKSTEDANKVNKNSEVLVEKQSAENPLNRLGIDAEAGRLASRVKVIRGDEAGHQAQNAAQNKGEAIKAAGSSGGNASMSFGSYEQNGSLKQMTNQLEAQSRAQTTQEFMKQNEVFNQIVRQARLMSSEGKSEATIQLKPEHLGRVQLKVTIENGTVTARFQAENPMVMQTLDQNMGSLRKALSDIGLSVTQLDVALMGGEAQLGNGEKNGNGHEDLGGKYSGLGPAPDEEDGDFMTVDAGTSGSSGVEGWRSGSTVSYVA